MPLLPSKVIGTSPQNVAVPSASRGNIAMRAPNLFITEQAASIGGGAAR